MTSFGIEWETNALIFDVPEEYKNPDIKEEDKGDRAVIVSGDFYSITSEYKDYKSIDTSIKDCKYNLEVQLGVFHNNKDYFDSRMVLYHMHSFFKNVWDVMIKNKGFFPNKKDKESINAQSDFIDVVSYYYGPNTSDVRNKDVKNNDTYTDCQLKENDIKDTMNPTMDFYYKKSLNDISGKIQMTIGIKLRYIINIFKRYTELWEQCQNDVSKCSTILKAKVYIHNIFKAYEEGLKFLKPGKEELASAVCLCYYTFLTFRAKGKGYMKSKFHIKPRTNIGLFNKMLSTKDKEEFIDWIDDLIENIGENVQYKNWLEEVKYPDVIAYAYPNSPILYSENDGKATMLEITGTPGDDNYPEYKGDNYNVVNVGEWNMGPNKTVYLEFRSPETIISLLDKNIYGEYIQRYGDESLGKYTENKLPMIVKTFIDGFLNKCF
jgi:hypothetical protein